MKLSQLKVIIKECIEEMSSDEVRLKNGIGNQTDNDKTNKSVYQSRLDLDEPNIEPKQPEGHRIRKWDRNRDSRR